MTNQQPIEGKGTQASCSVAAIDGFNSWLRISAGKYSLQPWHSSESDTFFLFQNCYTFCFLSFSMRDLYLGLI